jgi:Fe2+ or Zn2+ uptake regulation protein
VKDLEADVSLEPALRLATKQGFAADGAEVVVHGLCADCSTEAG